MGWPSKAESSALRFSLRIGRDGTARVTGTIRLEDGAGRRILIAQPGGTQASCADANDNDSAGLVRLQATFRDAETGTRLAVVLTPIGTDIDASGVYALLLQVGDDAPTTGEGFVGVRRRRRPQRR